MSAQRAGDITTYWQYKHDHIGRKPLSAQKWAGFFDDRATQFIKIRFETIETIGGPAIVS